MNYCENCGELFEKHHPSQRFCCKKCKDSYWNKIKPDRHKKIVSIKEFRQNLKKLNGLREKLDLYSSS